MAEDKRAAAPVQMADKAKDSGLESSEEAKPAVNQKDPPAPPAPPASKRLRVKCTERSVGSLWDPDRNQRISKDDSTAIAGPIAKGSWLDCQIEAGLIVVTED